MKDSDVQAKLNQLTRIANELHEEVKRRYGATGELFFEAEGQFHFMKKHEGENAGERHKGIVLSSDGFAKMDCGAW